MSQNSVIIHDEDTGPLTIKLSDSGRISLSDITAATIGNLESWDDPDSTSATHQNQSSAQNHSPLQNQSTVQNQSTELPFENSVLRPWENNHHLHTVTSNTLSGEISTRTEPKCDISQNKVNSTSVTSSVTHAKTGSRSDNSGDHLKRQLEDFYSFADGPKWKRPRQNVSTSTNNSAFDTFPTFDSSNKNWQNTARSSLHKTPVKSSFDNSLLRPWNDNSRQNQGIDYFSSLKQVSSQNQARSALMQGYKVSENYAYPSLSKLCDTPVSMENSATPVKLNIDAFQQKPHNCSLKQAAVMRFSLESEDIQNTKMASRNFGTYTPNKTSAMGSISNFYRDIFNTQDKMSPFQNSPSVNAVKYEQMTPVAKQQGPLLGNNMYDSPGVEARFNESLTNLIGSPPPDSPLSKNPFFSDLQALLSNECKADLIPKSLFSMQEKVPEPSKVENIFVRERKLHDRFNDLQASQPDEVRNLSSFFRYQTAMIETERFRTLHEKQYPKDYKATVNQYYDSKIHQVIDRVERSVILLENANKENAYKKLAVKPRPQLNKEAVQLMENWYKSNMDHPYPTNTTIELLAQSGNISADQVKKWFANKRNRSQNTRTLTEIAMKKRKLGHLASQN